ncbi:tail fiber domain-containing protein, partial [Candidatus Kaiserbacteria bacterium]|nr:tail fiber domain-containing protein [Candidatus Kaiserbacteria bacterium]
LVFIQGTQAGSTTLNLFGAAAQTASLLTISSSTGIPLFNINAVGQVAIATSTYPSSSTLFTIATSSQIFNISAGGNVMIGTSTSPNGALLTIATTSNIMTVLSNGNVGIGTTGPTTPLHLRYSNSATNATGLYIDQAGSGDAMMFFEISGVTNWAMGIDNSDSDKFKIAASNGLGTNPVFTIDTSGNVGIGTTGPSFRLDLEGSEADLAISLNNIGTGGRNYRIDSTHNSSGYGGGKWIVVDDTASGSPARLTIASDGTLSGSATNDISDARLKENVTVVGDALDKITQLRGVRFNWKEEAQMTDRPQFGVLAQEVEAVFPELVLNDSIKGPDYKSVQYGGFVAPFIEAIKELDQRTKGLVTTGQGDLIITGNVGIGTTNPLMRLEVQGNVADSLARIFNDGNATTNKGLEIQVGTDDASGTNSAIRIMDGDGGIQGEVTFSGGTVTYGAFTANHDVSVPESDNAAGYPYGTLTCIKNTYLKDNQQRGIEYNVEKCSSAYAKNVLGAYAGKYDDQPNRHQVYVLGDGHILVNGENGNIEIGDSIATSHAPGIGMKAAEFGLTIGIAQENITFASSEETKLVAVQYGLMYANADKINTQATTQDTSVFASVISAFHDAYDVIFDKGLLKVARIITTDQFCMDDTCITKDQFKALLEKNGIITGTSADSQPAND